MLSSTQSHGFGYLPCHLPGHASHVAPGFLQIPPIRDPAQIRAAVAPFARKMVDGIAQEMYVAELPYRVGQ